MSLVVDWTQLRKDSPSLRISVESPKRKSKQNKNWKNEPEQNIQGPWDKYKNYNVCVKGMSEREERDKGTESNIWNNNDWEIPQINVRHQITEPGSSENNKQDKCTKTKQNKKTPQNLPPQKKLHLGISND